METKFTFPNAMTYYQELLDALDKGYTDEFFISGNGLLCCNSAPAITYREGGYKASPVAMKYIPATLISINTDFCISVFIRRAGSSM